MVRGKCTLGRGLGPSPQESVIVPLSEHIYSSVFTGRQELSLSHYFKLPLGKLLGGKLECLGEKLYSSSTTTSGQGDRRRSRHDPAADRGRGMANTSLFSFDCL